MVTDCLHEWFGHYVKYPVIVPSLTHVIHNHSRYRENNRVWDHPVASENIVYQESVDPAVSIGERVDIDKSEGGHSASHDRRLTRRSL
jgi:hypothetical protein